MVVKVTKIPKATKLDRKIMKIKSYLLKKGFSHMDIQRYIGFMERANPLTMFRSFY